MNLGSLALRNLSGSSFRSVVIGLCVLVVAFFTVSTSVILRGAERSLQLALDRLGADLIVVPEGAEMRVETALLTGKPTTSWMPDSYFERIEAIPGVVEASPQLFLGSLMDAACCQVSEMFMIAVDPKTDFTVKPWLRGNLGRNLSLGEVVGGKYIFHPEGEAYIMLYGYPLMLVGNLEPTGTGIDQTLFMDVNTAIDMSRLSVYQAEKPLEIPPRSMSAVMVRTAPGASPGDVAAKIMREIPGVTAVESAKMFQSARSQMSSLLRSFVAVLAIVWVLSVMLLGLVFSISAHQRSREIGVVRALGSTRGFIFRELLAEAALLALAGSLTGILLAGAVVYLFRNLLVISLGIPFIFPTISVSVSFVGVGLAGALATVALAALLPALQASRQEPASAMRE